MSKLDAIKEKVANARSQLAEKTDKIPLLKKWKAAREESAKRGPNPLGIGEIYRQGGVGTRLQVILIFVFGIAALGFTLQAGKRIFKNIGSSSKAHQELQKEVGHGLEQVKEHAQEEAKVVSLGQFTTNAYGGPKGEAMVNLDIWLRVSDPETAAYVEHNTARLNDLTMETLNSAYHRKVNFLSDEGKAALRGQIMDDLNASLPKGKVVEVFFHNLVVQ